jgi:hypothetical protein
MAASSAEGVSLKPSAALLGTTTGVPPCSATMSG